MPQESRERKLENGIAVTIARIVSKFKTTTIVYSTYNNNNFIPHSPDTKKIQTQLVSYMYKKSHNKL